MESMVVESFRRRPGSDGRSANHVTSSDRKRASARLCWGKSQYTHPVFKCKVEGRQRLNCGFVRFASSPAPARSTDLRTRPDYPRNHSHHAAGHYD
jgi:hypothetical protein